MLVQFSNLKSLTNTINFALEQNKISIKTNNWKCFYFLSKWNCFAKENFDVDNSVKIFLNLTTYRFLLDII